MLKQGADGTGGEPGRPAGLFHVDGVADASWRYSPVAMRWTKA